jgi:hypothetical protein
MVALTPSDEMQLVLRESIRCYVRRLAGWDNDKAKAAMREAVALISRAVHDPVLAAELKAAEPHDLDGLLNGTST